MTSRERMRAALSGAPVDRVPFLPCIYIDHACIANGRRYEEALMDPRFGVRMVLEANSLYGSDVTRVFRTPPRRWFEEKEVRQEGDQLVQVDRRTGKADGRFDVQGGGLLILAEPPVPVRTMEQVEALTFPTADELIETGCMDAARENAEAAHERGLFVIGLNSGQTINFLVEKSGAPDRALMMMIDEPELAHRLIDVSVRASIEITRAFARVGVDGLYIGDSYASGSVISPRMYKEFCVPAYQRVSRVAHERGLLVYKHCCGNYNPLLEIVRTEELEGMEGIDPTSGMSVAHTREVVGDALCLIGGVSCLSLLQGSPESVYDEARACIKAGGTGGRYVLGSACAVPRYAPPANLHAMGRAAMESGRRGK